MKNNLPIIWIYFYLRIEQEIIAFVPKVVYTVLLDF